jgi:Mycotoxin biosynthesis protein UstYa
MTDWQSKNETLADELWDSLNMDSITVAISRDWAKEYGLPPSDPFYWDLDKDLYHIKGIHGMHCLVRTYFRSLKEN